VRRPSALACAERKEGRPLSPTRLTRIYFKSVACGAKGAVTMLPSWGGSDVGWRPFPDGPNANRHDRSPPDAIRLLRVAADEQRLRLLWREIKYAELNAGWAGQKLAVTRGDVNAVAQTR
jgi:hypothetical protein